ncbi:MAG: Ig-like domain-containing protein [Flavobacteriaceae bacterium]|nr:Ig-like domain-containing protein [Flavobacteriaceae bacterium]
MKRIFNVLMVTIFLIIFLSDCARRGRPEGGPKDEDAPIMTIAKPAHLTTNFKDDEIKIYFNEYIKLKDLQKQLIVSPPLKYPPIITPLGTPSKYITIKILDTLKENTTYTFNFGESVIDNTESNALHNFKYVFSTGDIIDSLKVSGTIEDAFDKDADKDITVMLYEVNESFTDSTIYNEKPYYVASTLDTTAWEITNMKSGKYLLMALKDASKNYKFNPKEDKIGFLKEYITIPKDSSNHIIKLFKEELLYKLKRPSENSKGRILFGYEGKADSLKVVPFETSEEFQSFSYFEKDKDTLNYWYKNNVKDSIQFYVFNKKYQDTVTVKLRSKIIDSLEIKASVRGTLPLRDQFSLLSNIPIQSIDTTKISFIDKDSVAIAHTFKIVKDRNEIDLVFTKAYDQRYTLKLLPSAITDFFGNVNDTLQYNLNTKKPIDYGNVYLTLQNVNRYPVIVQIIKEKGEFVEEIYAEKDQEYVFRNLIPSKYLIRIIYDDNKNKKWDTGNFLLKKQPEEVVYFDTVLDVRANWEMTETFILK